MVSESVVIAAFGFAGALTTAIFAWLGIRQKGLNARMLAELESKETTARAQAAFNQSHTETMDAVAEKIADIAGCLIQLKPKVEELYQDRRAMNQNINATSALVVEVAAHMAVTTERLSVLTHVLEAARTAFEAQLKDCNGNINEVHKRIDAALTRGK